MSPLVQTIVVALVVLGALAYVGRRGWRAFSAARAARRGDTTCAAGCGCDGASRARSTR